MRLNGHIAKSAITCGPGGSVVNPVVDHGLVQQIKGPTVDFPECYDKGKQPRRRSGFCLQNIFARTHAMECLEHGTPRSFILSKQTKADAV